MVTTQGHLLGGRVTYCQPATGYRSGIEPILLAAATPARPGERVLEAGTGAGAALLCLGARVPGIHAVGVEVDHAMAELARRNALANDFTGLKVVTGDIQTLALPAPFDHAIANPPYHPADGSVSPSAGKAIAKRGSEALLRAWIGRLSAALRDRGSLTLTLPAALVPAALAAMAECRSPCAVLFPLWPKPGRAAKLVLLRGIRNGRTPMRLAPGLTLHRPDGAFTADAEAILRDTATLSLDGCPAREPRPVAR